jgi:4-deoxy-L-threo-5-hexosulose-uronate ketol-isomerase
MNQPFHIVKRTDLPSSREVAVMETGALRDHFLVTDLFAQGEIRMAQTGLERMVLGGAMPDRNLAMPEGLTRSREWGVINLVGCP